MGEFYKAPNINGVTVPYDASIRELKKGLSQPMKYYVVCLRALAWKEDRTSFNILKNELRNPDYYRRRAALENISYHKLWKDSTELVRELLLDHSEYVVKLALKLLNSDNNCNIDVINEVVLVSDFWKENEEIIEDLEKIKYSTNPYNINRLTQVAGVKAIEENGYYTENCKRIIENREFTVASLKELGFDILPSKANFIFAKSDKIKGEELYMSLKDKGILVRHFKNERIKEFNRITIGSREEMESLIIAVKEILGERV